MSTSLAWAAFDAACSGLLASKCKHHYPYMGCGLTCDDVENAIGDEFRALQVAIGHAWITCLIYNVMNAAALCAVYHQHIRFGELPATRVKIPAERWWPGCNLEARS